MNFTRDPIVETIVSSKDGYKLLIRNTKCQEAREYSVYAVEVISFGSALFLRSQEKPRNFLLPLSEYEVLEMKETKMAVKNISIEKATKPIPKATVEKSVDEENVQEGKKKKKTTRKKKEKKAAVAPPEESTGSKRMVPPPPQLISETIRRYKDMVKEETEEALINEVEYDVPAISFELTGEEG